MWSDNETQRDLVNFSHVADIAAERIIGAKGEPLSIGISGNWGVGKSSMMKLLRTSLEGRDDFEVRFVEFNAWLYQNYDDARAALMEALTASLLEHATSGSTPASPGVMKRIGKLLGRVKTLRLLGMVGANAADWYANGHVTGIGAAGWAAITGLTDGNVTSGDIEKAKKVIGDATKTAEGLLKEKEDDDPPAKEEETPRKAIQAFRTELQDTLSEMGVTLVVLIDDLDRCLPKTAIATLEAMRLFLFLKHTAFVIAADDGMIRQAVASHFDAAIDEDQITNYFDKLIQLPIRVPPLGTQEVRAYLMMLFVDDEDSITSDRKDHIRKAVCKRLSQTWTGARVDKKFLLDTIGTCPTELQSRLGLAERIAPMLTTATKINGNPRLIKRFLNTLSMRKSMARIQEVEVDEEILVKMLLFERCGSKIAYAELLQAVNDSEDGRPAFLDPKEKRARGDETKPELENPWNDKFLASWLKLDPPLAEQDLRGALYVGRENHPIISRTDELSSDAVAALDMLLRMTSPSPTVVEDVRKLSNEEIGRVTDKVVARARQETVWAVQPIFNGLHAVATASPVAATEVVAFMSGIPSSQLRAALVQRLSTTDWGKEILIKWTARSDLKPPVRNAIASAAASHS